LECKTCRHKDPATAKSLPRAPESPETCRAPRVRG